MGTSGRGKQAELLLPAWLSVPPREASWTGGGTLVRKLTSGSRGKKGRKREAVECGWAEKGSVESMVGKTAAPEVWVEKRRKDEEDFEETRGPSGTPPRLSAGHVEPEARGCGCCQ